MKNKILDTAHASVITLCRAIFLLLVLLIVNGIWQDINLYEMFPNIVKLPQTWMNHSFGYSGLKATILMTKWEYVQSYLTYAHWVGIIALIGTIMIPLSLKNERCNPLFVVIAILMAIYGLFDSFHIGNKIEGGLLVGLAFIVLVREFIDYVNITRKDK